MPAIDLKPVFFSYSMIEKRVQFSRLTHEANNNFNLEKKNSGNDK